MKNHELRELMEDRIGGTEVCTFCKAKDGKIYLGTSGDYLVKIQAAKDTIKYCQKYLEHIDEKTINEYNYFLLNTRRMEREAEAKAYNKEKKKMITETNIYVMVNKRNGYYKIGRAKSVEKRERTLQAEDPDIEVLFFITGRSTIEPELHSYFSEKRIRGEWFTLTTEDLEFIKSYTLNTDF